MANEIRMNIVLTVSYIVCRMELTVSFNEDAHGEIHELLGGSWSRGVTAYADRTNSIVQPFVHKAVVRLRRFPVGLSLLQPLLLLLDAIAVAVLCPYNVADSIPAMW